MYIKPLPDIKITSKFGPRTHPVTKVKGFHNGVDFGAIIGTPCLAVADGIVAISKVNGGGSSKGYGYYIVIEHNGFTTLYAHLKKLGLPVGTRVKAGDVVALTGNSGESTGPHLHFEIRTGKVNGTFFTKDKEGKMPGAIDPETFKLEPEWESILRKAASNPDAWIKFFEENKNHPTGKFLPELVTKINNMK